GNYALHYVGGTPGSDITADYFGAWSRELTRLVGPSDNQVSARAPFLAALTNGCSGNINNIDFLREAPKVQPYEKISQVGRLVATEACRVWQLISFTGHVSIGVREATLNIRVRKPTSGEVDQARKLIAAAGEKLTTLEQI